MSTGASGKAAASGLRAGRFIDPRGESAERATHVPSLRIGAFLVRRHAAACGTAVSVAPPRPESCLDSLQDRKVAFSVARIDAASSSCAIDDPVRISRAEASWSPPGTLACGFALRLDTFLRDTVEPMARDRLGASIKLMRNYGTYSCRRELDGRRMSEHALGLAIDVAGFELADGDYVSVERDWHGAGAKSAFLHDFAQAACRKFSVVLTPDHNRAHRNHIHIDAGPYHLCGMRADQPTRRPVRPISDPLGSAAPTPPG
jgi:hypothetical protein